MSIGKFIISQNVYVVSVCCTLVFDQFACILQNNDRKHLEIKYFIH